MRSLHWPLVQADRGIEMGARMGWRNNDETTSGKSLVDQDAAMTITKMANCETNSTSNRVPKQNRYSNFNNRHFR